MVVALTVEPTAPSVAVVAKLPVVAPPAPSELLVVAVLETVVALAIAVVVVVVPVLVVAVVAVAAVTVVALVVVAASPEVETLLVVAAVDEVTPTLFVSVVVACVELVAEIVVDAVLSVVETSPEVGSPALVGAGSSTTVAHATHEQTTWKAASARGAARRRYEEAWELVTLGVPRCRSENHATGADRGHHWR